MLGFFKYLLSIFFILAISTKASPQSNIEWPAAIVEMHYNNTGPDINEYIEIHGYYMNSPFYFPFIFDQIHELRFFDNLGVLYKTLPIGSMQFYNAGGWGNYGPHNFAYYQFPPGEEFADAGKVQLINLYSGITVLAEYVYDGTGITEFRYIRPMAPRFFPAGENETTSSGLSLNFCGYYYSAGWSAAVMASSYGTNNACLILPVIFTDFNYIITSNKVRLQWKASADACNKYFDVERSGDGNDFKRIGTVTSSGISNPSAEYTYLDNYPAEINYYRIKQIPADGQPGYSKTLLVKMKGINPLSINSTLLSDRLQFNISLPQREIGYVQLIEMSGRTKMQMTGKSGNNEMNISSWTPGTYLLYLQTLDGRVFSQRFVKQ